MPIFANQSREEARRFYVEVWRKQKMRALLEPLEAQIAAIISEHPEYIPLLESGQGALTQDFSPESGLENPFAHMAVHQALREQVSIDRPPGVARQYRRITKKLGSAHQAEHAMGAVLAEMIWETLSQRREPDMAVYLERLRRL
jgi:hypothetical protein